VRVNYVICVWFHVMTFSKDLCMLWNCDTFDVYERVKGFGSECRIMDESRDCGSSMTITCLFWVVGAYMVV